METRSAAWHYFESVAESYSGLELSKLWRAVKKGECRRLMELVPAFRGKALAALELGAGNGYYSGQLLEISRLRLCAVDFSSKMLERHPHRCEKVLADIEELPAGLRARSFDLIFSAGVFEFLTSPGRVVAQLAKMQPKGGALVFTLPSRSILARGYCWFHRRHGLKIRRYGMSEIAEMAAVAGYYVGAVRAVPPFISGIQLIRL